MLCCVARFFCLFRGCVGRGVKCSVFDYKQSQSLFEQRVSHLLDILILTPSALLEYNLKHWHLVRNVNSLKWLFGVKKIEKII